MQRVSREKPTVDRSSLVAYAGAGAAIAFIAAMTFGAIDAPSDTGERWAAREAGSATHVVSVETPEDASRIR